MNARRHLVGALGAVALTAAVPVPAAAQGAYEELSRFSAVLRHISENHADSVTYRGLVRAAIDGMLQSLDPHSWFASAEDARQLNALERGELAVVGVELELVDDAATIVVVRSDSPADKAGVRPGDRVEAVAGEPVAGLTAQAVALRLAGERGSKVEIELSRGSRLEPDSVTVTLKRDRPRPEPSVIFTAMVDDSTGLVRLGVFGEKSADELRKAIRSLRDDGMRRLILDLRGNPGGIVTEAVAMASRFLPGDALVFTTRGRQRNANEEYRTSRGGEFRELPLAVLIDDYSASASEALAASLQDHDRALIAGRRSFGKGLVQTGFLVPDGYVQLTIAHVISPSGRFIQRPYRGLAIEQYRAFRGDSSGQDTTVYRTAAGRPVLGGGGVAPDLSLAPPPALPRWFTVAADSGWVSGIADSVGFSLESTDQARLKWQGDSAAWRADLVAPLLTRIRERLKISAEVSPELASHLGRELAARAALIRWGELAAGMLLVVNDRDVRSLSSVPFTVGGP